MRTLLSSLCQLRLGVVLRYHSLSSYNKYILQLVKNNLLYFVIVNFITIVDNSCQCLILFCVFDEVLPC